MELRKIIIGGLCCLAILGGVNYLLNQYGNAGIAIASDVSTSSLGGARQFEGKMDIKNSPYFAQPDIFNMQSNEHLTVLSHYKTKQQNDGYSCGPVAANTVVTHFMGKELHTDKEICQMMGTSSTNGTTTKGMVKYFEKIGWEVKSSAKDKTPDNYEDFLKFVTANLKDNTPIIVENVDWGGHWRVLIGYDTLGTEHTGDDVLLMADPFDTSDHLQDGYNVVSAERFFYMWFDSQLFSKKDQLRQWLTAKPKA